MIKIYKYTDLYNDETLPDEFQCENKDLHDDLNKYINNYAYIIDFDNEKYIIANFNRCKQSELVDKQSELEK